MPKAINVFCSLADESRQVPNLKGKKYAHYKIAESEWEILDLIREVLQVSTLLLYADHRGLTLLFELQPLRNAQADFSSEKSPTVWRALPTLELLIEQWELMLAHPKFASVAHGIEKGLAKLRKWYQKTTDSDVYFICLGTTPSLLFLLISPELNLKNRSPPPDMEIGVC